MKLLNRDQVADLVGLSIPSLYRLMQAGRFPRPLKIGLRAVRWRESEIRDFIASRPRASGETGEPPKAG